MTTATPLPDARPPARPFPLKALCALLVLRGLLALFFSILPLIGEAQTLIERAEALPVFGALELNALSVVLFAVGALNLVAAVGLWRFRPWAWRLALTLAGLQLLTGLWHQFDGRPETGDPFGLLLNILIVGYLALGDIRRLFLATAPAER